MIKKICLDLGSTDWTLLVDGKKCSLRDESCRLVFNYGRNKVIKVGDQSETEALLYSMIEEKDKRFFLPVLESGVIKRNRCSISGHYVVMPKVNVMRWRSTPPTSYEVRMARCVVKKYYLNDVDITFRKGMHPWNCTTTSEGKIVIYDYGLLFRGNPLGIE